MNRTVCLFLSSLFVLIFLSVGQVLAAGEFGVIFDVEGDVQQTSTGKTVSLTKNQHLLGPVNEGDRISVAAGRLVIVSIKENKAYEMRSGFQGLIKDNMLVSVKGKAVVRTGLDLPNRGLGGPIGGFVVRAPPSCIRAVSPANTWIIDLTPELRWQNNCSKGKRMTVKVIAGDSIIYGAEVTGDSLRLGQGVLKYGEDYRWVVDAGGAYNIGEAYFSVHEQTDAERISAVVAHSMEGGRDIASRLSYAFFLLSENVMDEARKEIGKLHSDFPRNEQIRKLMEETNDTLLQK